MVRSIHFRLIFSATLLASLSPIALLAQSQSAQSQDSQSIAEAAKRAREQKKSASKPAKILTEDDLDKRDVKPGESGLAVDSTPKLETEPPPAASVAGQEAADSAPTKPPSEGAPKAPDTAKAAQLKAELAEAEKELELLKREVSLQQDNFYSNADYAHDTAGKAKLDTMLAQVTDKQAAVELLKTQLEALVGPQGAAPPSTPPSSPQAPASRPQN